MAKKISIEFTKNEVDSARQFLEMCAYEIILPKTKSKAKNVSKNAQEDLKKCEALEKVFSIALSELK